MVSHGIMTPQQTLSSKVMLAVVLLELGKNPTLSPIKKMFPEDPAIVVVCPTTALEDDLVRVV